MRHCCRLLSWPPMAGSSGSSVPRRMKSVVEEMHSPAPMHVVEGLCARLRDIEQTESGYGEELANECRSFIYEQSEVKWLDVLVTAYLINGGVILREADSLQTDSQAGSQQSLAAQAESSASPCCPDAGTAPCDTGGAALQQAVPDDAADGAPREVPPVQVVESTDEAPQGVAPVPVVVESTAHVVDMDMLEIENMVNSLGIPTTPTP